MDFAKLIAEAERKLAAAQATRAGYLTEQTALIESLPNERASLTETDQARFDELRSLKSASTTEIDQLTSQLDELRKEQADDERLERAAQEAHPAARAQAPAAKVGREARTYTADSAKQGLSFFRDMFMAQINGDAGAQQRIQRHMAEVAVEGEGLSERAAGTGSFAGLIPPVYLTEEAAAIARAGRPTANIVRHETLPEIGQSIIIPRGTTGATEAVQATENSNVSNTDEVWANLTVPVVTIAGQQDVSRQSLERGANVDTIVYADLAGAYAVALDQQVLNGTGTSGQMLGILKTSGVGQASAFTAAADVPTFFKKLAGALNLVQTGRFLAPTVIIMHPQRWNWLLSQVDGANRPYVVPNANGPMNAIGVSETPVDAYATEPAGWILGLPVVTDASIPTSVGTGPEDQVIVTRKEDQILWENGDGSPFQLRFEQTLGNQLTVKLVAYNYAAFTAGRYPAASALIGGNAGTAGFGLITPTF